MRRVSAWLGKGRALALVAVLTLLLAACGGSQTTTAPTTATTTATSVAAPTTNAQPPGTLSVVEVVKRLTPSVVQVQTEGFTLGIFGRVVPQGGVGTGVIIDAERGYIVTNNHVIEIDGQPARRIIVTLSDGRSLAADIVGRDIFTDLAVLRIQADGLVAAKLGDSSQLQVGEEVVAIGQALALPGGPTVTKGVVSAKGRVIEEGNISIPDAIQTDAAINEGNSGGPLVNMRGEVVGITTAVRRFGSQISAEGIGLAISINTAKPIIDELIKKGRVERGFMGIGFADNSPALASRFGLAVERGVVVANVQPGSPAQRAGLRPMDVIVRVADVTIDNSGNLLQALTRYRAGDTVEVEYYRGQNLRTTSLTLTERPR